jgi:hypothetical protein
MVRLRYSTIVFPAMGPSADMLLSLTIAGDGVPALGELEQVVTTKCFIHFYGNLSNIILSLKDKAAFLQSISGGFPMLAGLRECGGPTQRNGKFKPKSQVRLNGKPSQRFPGLTRVSASEPVFRLSYILMSSAFFFSRHCRRALNRPG